MSKFPLLLISISLLILLFSCREHEKTETSTYTITRTTFEDILNIDGFVESVKTTTIGCPSDVNGTIQYLAEDGIYVNDSDVVCIIEDNELQRRYDESLINLEKAQAGLARSKANMDMQYALMEAQVKNNVAATQIANLDTSQLKYLSITNRRLKELELRKVSIEKRKLEKKLKSLGIINNAEIRSWDFQIRRYSNQADKMKEKLDALTIKAPQGGLITKANNWLTNNKNQVGDPVWNGMPIVYIPDLTKMKVKILASEGNYKRINVNDSVEYSFDAMPDNKAKGIIISKAPIGKPIKENSKIKIFEIEASINKADILPGPGLTTNCNVILKRINDTIVVPQIAIFEQDSMKVAYVKGTDKYEMRQVITGTSSQKNAIIVSGLSPNEIISLTKPKSNLISKKVLLPISVINKFKNNK